MILKPLILTCDHPGCKERHDFELPEEYHHDEWLGKSNFSVFYKDMGRSFKPTPLLYICSHHAHIYNDDDNYVRYYPKGVE